MKKFILALGILFGTVTGAFAQNGLGEVLPAPDTSKPYVLVDTSFIVGSYLQGSTTLYVHYNYTGSQKVKAIQTRIYFDTAAFSGVTATAGPSISSESIYFRSNRVANYLTLTVSYTGTNSNWTFPAGAWVKLVFTHGPRFYDVDPDSLKLVGTPTYPNKATINSGTDVTLGMVNYGGRFIRPPFTMPLYVFNQDQSPMGKVKVQFFHRKKANAAANWDSVTTYLTDSTTGKVTLRTNVDTSISYVKIRINGDTAKAGDAVNVTDAYKINDVVLETDTLSKFQYFAADINKNNIYTMSDVFLVFNRIAQAATRWNDLLPGTKDVMFFRVGQKQSIFAAPGTNFTSTITPTHDMIDTLNGKDSVAYWGVLLGDANGTGLTNIGMIIGKNTGDAESNEYVRDTRVSYRNAKETVSFELPRLTISNETEVTIPVTLVTNGVDVGSLQFGVVYDPKLLEFKNIDVSDKVKSWTSYILVKDNHVEWGGYEASNKQDVIRSNAEVFNLTFKVKNASWTESPISVVTKAVGNSKAEDVNINEANSNGKIVYMRAPIEFDFNNLFIAYPVPFKENLTIETMPLMIGNQFEVEVINQLGQTVFNQSQSVYSGGTQRMYIDLSSQPKGVYIVRYKNENKVSIKQVVKN
jgi:hypothetical protein